MQTLSNNSKPISSVSTQNNLKLGVLGAAGRLGSSIVKAASDDGRFDVEALSSREIPSGVESKLWIFAGLPTSLSACLHRAVFQNIRLVVGTTGLGDDERRSLEEAARSIPLFYSPNFSIGVALMKKLAEMAALQFHRNAHIDLIETHHATKKDSPSGTALWIAKAIEERHSQPCRIHSLRSGSIPGEHTLRFNTPEEQLIITHETHNPIAFGRGALAAALFLRDKPPGLNGMDHLLA